MLLTLEAVQAGCGDCLLLHYRGAGSDCKLMVIDGGPPDTYADYLEPRLQAIKESRSPDDPLRLDMVMVSHIDDDHAGGIVKMTEALVNHAADLRIITVWINTFEDLTQGKGGTIASAVGAATGAAYHEFPDALVACRPAGTQPEVTVASVKQGRQIRDNVTTIGAPVNRPLGSPITGPSGGGQWTADLGDGLEFTVLAPTKKQLDKLHREWDRKVAKLRDKTKPAEAAEAAAFLDGSVYNLSSIAVLAEAGGKKLLLTGDARGDMILEGLHDAGKLGANGSLHVDILKLPHHGSENNVDEELFRKITAGHYVICANGRNGNPDPPTLEMLTTARGSAPYTIAITNTIDHAEEFFRDDRAAHPDRRYQVVRGAEAPPYVRVDLGDEELND